MSRPRGFTLVELLIAVALLALVAALGYRGLGSLLDAETRLQAETRRWGDLAAVMAQIAQDVSLATARPEGGPAGELFITRMGEAEGGALQSGPQRVGYRLREGKLEYLVWTPDARPGAAPAVSAVLEGVAALELRALRVDGSWEPLRGDTGVLPRAVEAQIVLAGGEQVSRLLLVR